MFTLGSNVVGTDDQHPDNAGLACWLAGLPPADGGRVLYDLTGNTPGATLQGGAAWAATPYGQSAVRMIAGGESLSLPPKPYQFGAGAVTMAATVYGRSWAGDTAVVYINSGGNLFVWQVATVGGTTYLFTDGVNAGNNISLSGAEIPSLNAWHRLVFAVAAGAQSWRFSVDGRLVKSGAFGLSTGGASAVTVGRRNATMDADFAAVAILPGFAADAGWAARDYEWSQDPHRDPRLRRTSTRSLFVTAAGVPASSFVPAFAPGWGW